MTTIGHTPLHENFEGLFVRYFCRGEFGHGFWVKRPARCATRDRLSTAADRYRSG